MYRFVRSIPFCEKVSGLGMECSQAINIHNAFMLALCYQKRTQAHRFIYTHASYRFFFILYMFHGNFESHNKKTVLGSTECVFDCNAEGMVGSVSSMSTVWKETSIQNGDRDNTQIKSNSQEHCCCKSQRSALKDSEKNEWNPRPYETFDNFERFYVSAMEEINKLNWTFLLYFLLLLVLFVILITKSNQSLDMNWSSGHRK